MKSIIITAVALLATTASAGLVKGACPTVTALTYTSSMGTSNNHHLLYMDQTLYSYLGLNEKIDAKSGLPDTQCFNLGDFGYSSAMFTGEFVTSSALSLQMLYYDDSTGTQVAYDCIDAAKIT